MRQTYILKYIIKNHLNLNLNMIFCISGEQIWQTNQQPEYIVALERALLMCKYFKLQKKKR